MNTNEIVEMIELLENQGHIYAADMLRQQQSLLDAALKALEMIATGEIKGEEKNFKDTVYIMRNIANEVLLRKAQV